jgi:predicted amidohydrolase
MRRSAKYGVWLIPGTVFERGADGNLYNTASVIDPSGTVVKRYRKMFPFRPYEHDVTSGQEFCVFDVPDVGRFGLSICYDMWLPETTRTLTAMGAEVLLHPVLTGTIDRDVELAIARATAAQFQCYVFDINGLDAGGIGRSCVVDPSGTMLAQAGGSSETLPLEVDLGRVRRQREAGVNGLGQPLKSFRDREIDFAVYQRGSGLDSYLHTLGPLTIPHQGGQVGIGIAAPADAVPSMPAAMHPR